MKDRKRAAAEQSLLDAAEVELADGFAKASMQSIAARAGVAVGTLYNYFDDKDALVRALLDARRKAIANELDALEDTPGSFEQRLRATVQCIFGFFEAHRAFLRISLHADQSVMTRRRSSSTVLADRLRKLIDQGIAEGAIRPAAAPLAAEAFASMIKSILFVRVDDKGSFVDLVDGCVDIVLHGIARDAPRAPSHAAP
jgi:AcrR family transcriptional regulator